MDRCPPEICSQIFTLACTDGGYTGRSLSAVSKYIHETSKPHKYKSIALHGVYSAEVFASFLEARSSEVNRGVMHLFVSNDHEASNSTAAEPAKTASFGTSLRRNISSKMSNFVPGGRKRETRQRIAEAEADLRRDVANIVAIIKVLKIVAPTLRTLTICFSSRSCTLPFLESTSPHAHFPRLPALTELTVSYRAPMDGGFNYYFFCFPKSAGSFPSLKRLDISSQTMDNHFPETLYLHIATMAPSLTHLCLPSCLSLHLQNALWDGLEDDGRCMLPSTLRRVCILFDVCHSCTWGSNRSHCHRCQMLMLARADYRIVLVDDTGDEIIGYKSRQKLFSEWQERMNGSEIFWEEPDELFFS